eukprot:gnl/TRDRNA2_/TRDRNA2_84721_c0_seq1.p1 gnl/TRDRNA2_/TRDRNA2_84721_c0~~gnl/TRDRNA2_/TRDRNA2_84721_c0_seq1.p1  ORF type:complete len:179 (+),score=27.89 gnl/TRDRNA2_/TRDRNA2_84721_c0_seq1:66-539(+)
MDGICMWSDATVFLRFNQARTGNDKQAAEPLVAIDPAARIAELQNKIKTLQSQRDDDSQKVIQYAATEAAEAAQRAVDATRAPNGAVEQNRARLNDHEAEIFKMQQEVEAVNQNLKNNGPKPASIKKAPPTGSHSMLWAIKEALTWELAGLLRTQRG